MHLGLEVVGEQVTIYLVLGFWNIFIISCVKFFQEYWSYIYSYNSVKHLATPMKAL